MKLEYNTIYALFVSLFVLFFILFTICLYLGFIYIKIA